MILKLIDLFQQNDDGKLVLPDFQRSIIWDVNAQRKLLASFLAYLPVGSILLLKGKKEDFAAKKLCFSNQTDEAKKEECLYLLDGQQRISSLKIIFSDFFNDNDAWENILKQIYISLRNRWFLKVKPDKDKDEEDIFGWDDLQFKDFNLKKCEPTQIIDRIVNKKIFKTKKNEWYNPGYEFFDGNREAIIDNKRKNEIAKHAAEDYLVPLFSIYEAIINSSAKPLHKYVLDKISENRVDELKADVADGRRDIIELLQNIEPDIDDIVKNNEENKVRDAWANLKAEWSKNFLNYLNTTLDRDIPIIELSSDEISRAVSIFENINKGGTPLSQYDLIVAKAARNRDLDSLTKRISDILDKSIEISSALWNTNKYVAKPLQWYPKNMDIIKDDNIATFFKEQYLNLLSIYSYFEYGNIDNLKLDYIKKAKIMEIDYGEINNNTVSVVIGLMRACAFLQFRCGVVKVDNICYKLMILPIAYILINDEYWNNHDIINKIEYWYWSALFGGAYRGGQNKQCIEDVKNLYLWIKNIKANPFRGWFDKILNDQGYSDKKVLLMEDINDVPASMHNAILQYILSNQPSDFYSLPPNSNVQTIRLNTWEIAEKKKLHINGKSIVLEIEDHHLCPLNTVTQLGESTQILRKDKKHKLNSPLNRTYITKEANRLISGRSPIEYFQFVSQFAQWGHCVPTPFEVEYSKISGEENEVYHKRVLEKRYAKLLEKIKIEIDPYGSL